MKFVLISIALVSFSSATLGQSSGNPENWCREGFFTRDSDDFRIATVEGAKGSRKYFYSDDSESQKCPESAGCRLKTYLIPGDKVVANRVRGNSMCVWYTPAKGSPTVGWMRSEDLTIEASVAKVGLTAWLGEWTYGENTINFTNNKLAGWLNVTGSAVWKGVGDNVHVGELDGRAEPRNGSLVFSDGADEFDCRATMRLVGGFLVVADNLQCGGMNVTFSGVYRRLFDKRGVR